ERRQVRFDLVVATNHPDWRVRLSDDFRDRIEDVVIELPSFNQLRKDPEGLEDLVTFFLASLHKQFDNSRIPFVAPPEPYQRRIRDLFARKKLDGNWRLFRRLAANLLLAAIDPRGGRPTWFE